MKWLIGAAHMHDYGVSTEVVRMALALGVIISILVYEKWRLTGGAAVVAGYLGLFLNRPLYILVTIGLAVATYFLVQRFVARRMFLYGRRRLVVMVMVGMGLQAFTGAAAFLTKDADPWLVGLFGVGFVLPGL
ncbi:MAG: poly-gamma-glutamate biosynthesis protein PgsC/CapC, partial [Anaerolineae bacterium]